MLEGGSYHGLCETLGAGGDGGVFASGNVAGALPGLVFATMCNSLLGQHLLPLLPGSVLARLAAAETLP